jgi:CrcB protein
MSAGLVWLVGAGGTLGALMRYGVGRFIAAKGKPGYIATLIVNLVGSFVIGLFIGMRLDTNHHASYVFLAVGILGGLTTYSTLNVQKATLGLTVPKRTIAIYLSCTYIGGLVLTAIGAGLGSYLH